MIEPKCGLIQGMLRNFGEGYSDIRLNKKGYELGIPEADREPESSCPDVENQLNIGPIVRREPKMYDQIEEETVPTLNINAAGADFNQNFNISATPFKPETGSVHKRGSSIPPLLLQRTGKSWKLHRNMNAGVKMLFCKLCNYRTWKPSSMKVHKRVHMNTESVPGCRNSLTGRDTSLHNPKNTVPEQREAGVHARKQSRRKSGNGKEIDGDDEESDPTFKPNGQVVIKDILAQGDSAEDARTCTECNYKAKGEANLVQHLKIHTGEIASYKCDKCNYATEFKGNLKLHLKKKHVSDINTDSPLKQPKVIEREKSLTSGMPAVVEKSQPVEPAQLIDLDGLVDMIDLTIEPLNESTDVIDLTVEPINESIETAQDTLSKPPYNGQIPLPFMPTQDEFKQANGPIEKGNGNMDLELDLYSALSKKDKATASTHQQPLVCNICCYHTKYMSAMVAHIEVHLRGPATVETTHLGIGKHTKPACHDRKDLPFNPAHNVDMSDNAIRTGGIETVSCQDNGMEQPCEPNYCIDLTTESVNDMDQPVATAPKSANDLTKPVPANTQCEQPQSVLTRKKPFKCNVCGYSCSSCPVMRAHLECHIAQKLLPNGLTNIHVCDVCGYRSKKKSLMIVHARTHTSPNAFRCDECGFQTHYQPNLRRHKLKKHSDGGVEQNGINENRGEAGDLGQHLGPTEEEMDQFIETDRTVMPLQEEVEGIMVAAGREPDGITNVSSSGVPDAPLQPACDAPKSVYPTCPVCLKAVPEIVKFCCNSCRCFMNCLSKKGSGRPDCPGHTTEGEDLDCPGCRWGRYVMACRAWKDEIKSPKLIDFVVNASRSFK